MTRFLLVLLFCVVCCSVVFGQQPGAAQQPVVLKPIVDFGSVIGDITQFYTDILKKYWVVLLSIFFVWFIFCTLMSFLEGRVERWRAEIKRVERIDSQMGREEERAVARARAREMQYYERRWRSEIERDQIRLNRSRRIVLGAGETFEYIGSDRYIRSESHGVVHYRTFDQWREEHDPGFSESADFDSASDDWQKSDDRDWGDFTDEDRSWFEGQSWRDYEEMSWSDLTDEEREWVDRVVEDMRSEREEYERIGKRERERMSSGLDDGDRDW